MASHESFHETKDLWKTPGGSTGRTQLPAPWKSRKTSRKVLSGYQMKNRDAQKKRTKKYMFNAGNVHPWPTTPINSSDGKRLFQTEQWCLSWPTRRWRVFWEWKGPAVHCIYKYKIYIYNIYVYICSGDVNLWHKYASLNFNNSLKSSSWSTETSDHVRVWNSILGSNKLMFKV